MMTGKLQKLEKNHSTTSFTKLLDSFPSPSYEFDPIQIEQKMAEVSLILNTDQSLDSLDYQGHFIDWQDKMIFCPLAPKLPLKGFESKIKIFMSAKKPIMINCIPEVELQECRRFSFIFKYGDDLRQDNLVLQMFKMMDRIWAEDG